MQTEYATSDPRAHLPYPNGWFAACFTHELKRGKILTVSFMGRDLVLYRTESGEVRAITPYCPHLGAHFGHGGRVEGENLVCPFHGFVYGQDGRCLRTGTGQQPPNASLDLLPIREVHGLVFVWHHHARAVPDWDLPAFDTANFSRPVFSRFPVKGYVQDLAENTADNTHLQFVHKMGSNFSVTEHATEGHKFKTCFNTFFGWRSQIPVCCHGLGAVIGKGGGEDMGLEFRIVVAAAPRGPLRWDFMHTVSFRVLRPRWVPAAIRRAVASVLLILSNRWVKSIAVGDIPIFNHRTCLEHPMLTKEDMPFVIFRRWAKQFYPPTEAMTGAAQPQPMPLASVWRGSSKRVRAQASMQQSP